MALHLVINVHVGILNDAEREENAFYTYQQQNYHALLPRIPTHRCLGRMFFGLDPLAYIVDEADDEQNFAERTMYISLRVGTVAQRLVLRNHFQNQEDQIAEAFNLMAFTFMVLPAQEGVVWDLAEVNFDVAIISSFWTPLMNYLHETLVEIESGIQPSAPVLIGAGNVPNVDGSPPNSGSTSSASSE
ncbi:hypothetical protein niasHT_030363 [Heterodera trifolii]|uniref:Uncharacterized protein n=1 Tax=Heterodera trifolii TaxID=157864 RepID=A0ABD2JMW3_9BILA